MPELIMIIDKIQNDVFNYRLNELGKDFLQLVDLLSTGMQTLSVQDQALLAPVLRAILTAYERKDYLLTADILFFELRPLLMPAEEEHSHELLQAQSENSAQD